MVPIYAQGASGAMVVFDRARRSTFENIETWIKFASTPRCALILVGNTSDLELEIEVNADEARAVADRFHCPLFCTSAQTGFGVEDAFVQLVKRAVQSAADERSGSVVCDLSERSPQATGCC
jgi:GTPase SAR1 family protein